MRFFSTSSVSPARSAARPSSFTPIELSDKGKVYVFSVVHQSFPGIKTPYITAIVDLPEGVSVRSQHLIDVDPEDAQKNPKKMFDMPVEMVTNVVAKDREGHEVVAFRYRPSKKLERYLRAKSYTLELLAEIGDRRFAGRRQAARGGSEMRNVYVLGTGMIKFGRYPDKTVPELGGEAAILAIKDAGVTIKDVEMFACGNLYQSNAMVGQRILQQIGQTGIPVINVSNACATGSTAFREAYMAVAVGDVRRHDGGRRRADGQAGTARRWRRRHRSGLLRPRGGSDRA